MTAEQPAPTPEQIRQAEWLVQQTRDNDGLAPVDLERFWADNELARKDPFGPEIPQAALGIRMNSECVFAELGLAEDRYRFDHDAPWRAELVKAYNDKAERIVGRRLLNETEADPTRRWPAVRTLADIFEARNVWHHQSQSYWLEQSATNEDELSALLDRVEATDIRSFILPDSWETEKARLTALGVPQPRYRGQRGPVTFACSVFGPENLIFLLADNPVLGDRFRDAILNTMLGIARVLDEEAGDTPQSSPRGFWWADDNCCLLTADMYERFGYPILKGMFDVYAPDPQDIRHQHSDSAMGHLLPVLSRLSFRQVNFGPTVPADEIRRHMPRTIIQGQLAPFTFSRDEQLNIVLEFLRDFEMTRESRGLLFDTAGSINNGSRLTGMRLIMSAIQHFGRFDR